MTGEEYRRWLAARKGKGVKAKIPKAKPVTIPEVPFLTWLLVQVGRQDDTGRLARDVASERKRIEKPLSHLNNRVDVLWHCMYAPRSAGLTREIGVRAWAEWRAFERAKEEAAARNGE